MRADLEPREAPRLGRGHTANCSALGRLDFRQLTGRRGCKAAVACAPASVMAAVVKRWALRSRWVESA